VVEPSDDSQNATIPVAEKERPYFHWDYITDAVLKEWSGIGAAGIKSKLAELAADKANEIEISIIFQELIQTAIDLRLSPFMVARFLTDFFEKVTTASGLDLKRIFVQTVGLFETSDSIPTKATPSPPANLVKLLQDLRPRVLPDDLLGLYLETPTLVNMGIVSSMFSKKAVRVTTALVYKQRKHNLLREETEGFSKLITEFFTASYSASPLEAVGRTGERVKSLIGAFELDPGRVLDVLLDTAACTVVSNARFFVRLLKGSAWWPQQLPGLGEDDGQKGRDEVKADKEREKEFVDRAFFDKLSAGGISVFFEGLEAGKGNRVAAQLLGFKFRYYQSEDVKESTPENLLVLSALLIKIGFVDLADLYPHLAPQDEEGMNEVLETWKAKLLEKQLGGRRNALLMAGALSDDTSRSRSNNSDEKKQEDTKKVEEPKPKKQDNQKLVLLKYLLAVGALPEAMFILGKYPWLPAPSEDIAEHLARVLAQSLDGLYPCHQPPSVGLGNKKICSTQGAKTGGVEQYDQPRRKPMVTFTVSNLKLNTGDIEYRFFWDEWKEGVPICREPKHVVVLLETLGRVLGVGIGRDANVMTRVCRIGRDVLRDPNCTPKDRSSWVGLARNLLIPAVSMTEGNQGVVNEVWKLLECFPTETRYSLYGEWISVMSKKIPELRNKVTATERETKDLLKRISKTNVKQMARQLAKVATSNPVIVMQVVLGQVEGYDNLIECVVDAARYFTPLGFDAVAFCVLNR
jgi:THO complex subunit 2